MHKSALLNQEDTFPSKNYSKYRSQSKTNPLLHKLNQDIGYPQDVLATHSTIIVRNNRNYLDLNKKNLKNFFSDRLPPKEVDIYRENFTIDPSRLFQIKKRQHQLKAQTRSKLEEKLDTSSNPGKLDPKKISEIFQFNDKNQEFKKRVLGSQGVKIVQPYQPNNFLKGTTSYVRKYNEITKKRAYNSVFGPEASATTRNSMTARSNRQNSTISRPFTTIEDRKKFTSPSGSKDLDRQKKFTSLIKKIDGYRKSLDPQNRRGMRQYIAPKQSQDNEMLKTELITWIKDTAKSYKNNSIETNREHIHNVDDLVKIDEDFYKDLKKHKAKRLSHRSNYVQNVLVHHSTARNSTRQEKNIQFQTKSNHSLSEASRHQSEQYSISSNQDEEDAEDGLHKHSPAYLLKKFIRLLVDALTQARFYGIQNKQNIYKAFWKNPDPYEKSGSYAFFKAVKKGQLSAVQSFLKADPDYVYQRDHKGRSPLIIATLSNHTHLINFFLNCDVNVNKRCFSLKTCLYYAIRNENVDVVKKILQKGALPWSTKSCRYNKLLQKIKNPKIENLMKNARKVGILIQMQSNKTQKVTLWKNLKHKITENQIITF